MTLLFLALLGVAWIAVFLPAALRARAAAPLSTAERFKRRMDLLAPRARSGRWVVVPESYDRLRAESFRRGQTRRKQIFVVLLCCCVLTLVAALAAGGSAWEVNLALDASLALYVVLLREAKKRRTERSSKVRSIARMRQPEEAIFHEPRRAASDRA